MLERGKQEIQDMTGNNTTGNLRIVRNQMQAIEVAPTDSKLSYGAFGLWVHIQLLPEGDFTLKELQDARPNTSRADTTMYYHELLEAGYIQE